MNVPFLDLKAQYQTIKEEIDAAIQQVVDSCAFAGGPFVEKFETEFAAWCGVDHAVGVGSGTDALWLALLALGIGPGDEVVTVPNTFIATAEAITYCGAFPVFVDVEEGSYNMDPAKLREFLEEGCRRDDASGLPVNKATGRTVKAVIPVHLYGLMADMEPIMETARAFGLKIVEDASQAHGAWYKGKRAGAMGDAGCFSFYPGKNLGAYGEAGAVVTGDAELANTMKMLRDHGQQQKYIHKAIGWNGRMDGIQGTVLSVKMKHIDAWTQARMDAADRYDTRLEGVGGLVTPSVNGDQKHVFHIYPVRVVNREAFMKQLLEKGIHTGIHYPIPLHLQEAYAFMGQGKGAFPIAEKC
jgi:dTDP-4-amino-4,6-dideoxygalactose transaminase